MAKATIYDHSGNRFGKVDFDPMNLDSNIYDLFVIAVVDPDTNEVVKEERYLDEDDFKGSIRETYGREWMNDETNCGWCMVEYDCAEYECEATYYISYVIDHEEE